jgi:hypothetical protein
VRRQALAERPAVAALMGPPGVAPKAAGAAGGSQSAEAVLHAALPSSERASGTQDEARAAARWPAAPVRVPPTHPGWALATRVAMPFRRARPQVEGVAKAEATHSTGTAPPGQAARRAQAHRRSSEYW